MSLHLLEAGKSYTFRSYFEMPYEPDEILAEFGYRLQLQRLGLPRSDRVPPRIGEIQQQIEEILPLTSLSSETARRELLVAPLLIEIARFHRCQLRIEYPLVVNDWLKGNLDYLLRSTSNVAIVEAKRDDLTRGFVQLAVELIAFAQKEAIDRIFGAVTIGEIWKFACLDASQKTIVQDLNLYRVPDDLDALARILVALLEQP